MCINKAIQFCDFKSFYDKYKPLTPYGYAHKESMPFYKQADDLDAIHQSVDTWINFINEHQNSTLKVVHHLSRIDKLNTLDKKDYDIADLQLIKKFLIHTKAIEQYLPIDIAKSASIAFQTHSLLNILMPDDDKTESFHLSSAFDPQLQKVREQICQADQTINNLRIEAHKQLLDKLGFDFSNRDFILVDKKQLPANGSPLLLAELYDSKLIKLRVAFDKTYMDAQMLKEQLLNEESEIEKRVLKSISEAVRKQAPQLLKDIDTITQLDVHLAMAQLSVQLQLLKPNYRAETIVVDEGIYYPLFERHQQKDLRYTPLRASFGSNAILLSGSNMGGKTVLFKTIAFLQLLTQMGFRVPAQAYATKLFDEIQVLGTTDKAAIEGLSSFGQEIHQLSAGLTKGQSRLLLVDELAKTTNATEAKAILVAVLKFISQQPLITGFFSTHFINIPHLDGVIKYRMRGLDKEAFQRHCHEQTSDINDKIRQINAYMQYELKPDEGVNHSHDALTIANMLGLQAEIIDYANDYLDK
ncbi:hypothetical protein [Carboxylicivirga sp. M1479]|uniref:lysine 5,6-aminomutase reactivase ATPase KamC n=1 Tax=Carboxylicivirga sp. M1479 TaxID=2594476 RepID=UPI00117755BC|nr:hypothetical protein [Carboxylicivirga sp. M1479]TRX71851.1 hypothetical protein FNN09_04320 [Carboxylicivirga sp. M1479]